VKAGDQVANLLGCLDRPTSGQYLLDGIPVEGLDRDHLAEIRNQNPETVKQWPLERSLTSDFSSVVEEYSFRLSSSGGFIVRNFSHTPAAGWSVSSLPGG
jgi:hypothetical protein